MAKKNLFDLNEKRNMKKKILYFQRRESNPGRGGESAES